MKLCYSYFIDPTDLVELFILRFHMNQSCNKNLKKDQRRVEEIVSSRAITGIELLLQQFNIDNVIYPPKFTAMMREFTQEIGISSAKTILFHLAEVVYSLSIPPPPLSLPFLSSLYFIHPSFLLCSFLLSLPSII